jgi:transcriptional regulator with XRE-family HTH domain
METLASTWSGRIAERVREMRVAQSLSLDALASKSGISRSMISLIERGESSPTAVVLEKLAAGLDVTLPSLFDPPASSVQADQSPIARREHQLQWRDPESGYIRRNISPAGVRQPMQIVEVQFPPGERVTFESGSRDNRIYQQIWVFEGKLKITQGSARHQLREGDCLAMELDGPVIFHNPSRTTTRYAVVIAFEGHGRR